ncbi:hypothetical protein BDF14DRAFT_1797275 [Spinellus fusiger]|nr:hypothetical protein BDF14DRAFT_1797275 [Spinellus fusiger]
MKWYSPKVCSILLSFVSYSLILHVYCEDIIQCFNVPSLFIGLLEYLFFSSSILPQCSDRKGIQKERWRTTQREIH